MAHDNHFPTDFRKDTLATGRDSVYDMFAGYSALRDDALLFVGMTFSICDTTSVSRTRSARGSFIIFFGLRQSGIATRERLPAGPHECQKSMYLASGQHSKTASRHACVSMLPSCFRPPISHKAMGFSNLRNREYPPRASMCARSNWSV